MKAPTKRETRRLAASLAIVTALATSGAWARNQYWSDGSGDHKWSTASNWSGGSSQNAEFRGSKFNPEATSYVINIDGNQTASWKLYVCGVGSENTPLVFRNTDKDKTLTIGTSDNSNVIGYYIAYNEGDAWLQLECGKYTTYNHSNARWHIGSANYKGYVIVDEDATLVSIGKMFLNQGTVYVKSGGIVKTTGIVYGSGTGGATITIDGGILKAMAADTLIAANNKLTVTVGSNGGTIDNGAYNVTIASAIGGTGGMTFTGGGTTTLNGAVTYEGATTIEVGTTVVVASTDNIGGGLLLTVPATAPADGVYTVLSVSGDETLEGFTLPDAPENCSLRLSPDKKSLLCIYGDPQNTWIGGESGSLSDNTGWSFGFVPGSGESCVIGNEAAAASLTVGETFAPSAITFPSGSESVTIDGRDLTGIVAVTNLSSASHTINAKVYFTSGINVKQNASSYTSLSQSHVTFAGGAYAASGKTIDSGYSVAMFGKYYFANTSNWTATEEGDSRKALASNSELYVPKAGNTSNLYISGGAKVNVASMSLSTGVRLSYKNYGEMVVTNLTLGNFSSDIFLTWYQGVSSVFRFNSFTNTSNGGTFFWFADDNVATKTTLYFGAGGVGFSGSGLTSTSLIAFGKDVTNNETTIRPWDSDFTIGGKSNANAGIRFGKRVIFNTDDDSGVGHTITLAAKYYGGTGASVDVGGSGKLLVTGITGSGAYPMTVTDTATLAVGASGSLGTGAITLGAGTTLALTANSSTFAALTNTLNLPTTGTATIRIDGTRLSLGDHEIATVGTGSTENVVLDPASTALGSRKAKLRVEGGRLLLSIKSAGTIFIVR